MLSAERECVCAEWGNGLANRMERKSLVCKSERKLLKKPLNPAAVPLRESFSGIES